MLPEAPFVWKPATRVSCQNQRRSSSRKLVRNISLFNPEVIWTFWRRGAIHCPTTKPMMSGGCEYPMSDSIHCQPAKPMMSGGCDYPMSKSRRNKPVLRASSAKTITRLQDALKYASWKEQYHNVPKRYLWCQSHVHISWGSWNHTLLSCQENS